MPFIRVRSSEKEGRKGVGLFKGEKLNPGQLKRHGGKFGHSDVYTQEGKESLFRILS